MEAEEYGTKRDEGDYSSTDATPAVSSRAAARTPANTNNRQRRSPGVKRSRTFRNVSITLPARAPGFSRRSGIHPPAPPAAWAFRTYSAT